eukprot:TRINITY_DN201_c0_g1_i1.p1 TRINITY_DN201_c0_g1~~TRINITY_DN201_c0_g1_i1.p1  ORF type:complete len:437 (-),score=66.27 TRINITY_DN201_c0_g1_i1:1527-2837(-)
MPKACDACQSNSAVIFCRADAAYLCVACDTKVHGANKLASRHERVWMCEVCEVSPAVVTCKADAAALCFQCDADIHSANPLARRHERVPVTPFYECPTGSRPSHISPSLSPHHNSSAMTDCHGSAFDDSLNSFPAEDHTAVDRWLVQNPQRPLVDVSPAATDMSDMAVVPCSSPFRSSFVPTYAEGAPPSPLPPLPLASHFPQPPALSPLSRPPVKAKIESGVDMFADTDRYLDLPRSWDLEGYSGQQQPMIAGQAQAVGVDSSCQVPDVKFGGRGTASSNLSVDSQQGPGGKSSCGVTSGRTAKPGGYGSSAISSSSLDVGVVPDTSDVSNPYDSVAGGPLVFEFPQRILHVGQLEPMAREARVLRYREKKKRRKFEKTIRYASRKVYAESRPRVKGRFAKRGGDTGSVDEQETLDEGLLFYPVNGNSFEMVPSF